MSTDPSQVRLSNEQRRCLADLADQVGRPWTAVFSEAIADYRLKLPPEVRAHKPKAIFGGGKALVTLSADFDEPLADFREFME